MPVELICGDALEVMRGMADKSVDAIVTDPPYALTANKKGGSGAASVNLDSPYGRSRVTTGNGPGGFMGQAWDSQIPGPDIWLAALRVSKPGAHLLAFGGTRTFHRLTCAIEDAGWEIRDCIMWVYGSGFPKSHNLDGEWRGWGTALKPAWEPIIVARKALEGTVAENVQRYSTGAINVDGCRIRFRSEQDQAEAKPQGRATTKAHGAAAATPDAGRGIERIEFPIRQSDLGRWPANLVHDGSKEVLGRFPEADAGTAVRRNIPPSGKRCDGTSYVLTEFPRADMTYADSGSAARFFYCAKASRSERNAGLDGLPEKMPHPEGGDGRAWDIPGSRSTERANHHPTVKPVALMRWLCRLVTPPGGRVLDPFCGSGSTGLAADREGFSFIGIDLNPEYVEMARRRIAADAPLLNQGG